MGAQQSRYAYATPHTQGSLPVRMPLRINTLMHLAHREFCDTEFHVWKLLISVFVVGRGRLMRA